MANQELKALIRIGGDGSGAQTAMRQVAASAQALGANVIKVQETVNTALERRIEATQKRIDEARDRLKAIDIESKRVTTNIAQAKVQKAAIDPKIAGSVEAIVKANTALVKTEADLAKAITARDKTLVDGTRAEIAAEHAAENLAQARRDLRAINKTASATEDDRAAAARRVIEAERQDEIAQANLTLARMKAEDANRRVQLIETQRAQQLMELNRVEGQAGEQTQKLVAAKYKLEEATQNELKAEDRLARAELAVQHKATAKNTKELEAARKAVERATLATVKAEDEYQTELTATNQMQARSAELTNTIESGEKQLTALERERAQEKRNLASAEDKMLGLEERQLNVTYKNTQANRAANTEWGKTWQLIKQAGASYAQAGRQFAQAGREIVTAARQQTQQIKAAALAIKEHVQQAKNMGIAWKNPLSMLKLGTGSLGSLAKALIATAKATVSLTTGTAKLVLAFGRMANAVRTAISGMSRMNGIAKSLGVGFATTGAHVGGIAVRLNAMQMGLYAAGGAFTTFGNKGKEVFGDLLKVAGDFQQELVTITATLGSKGAQWTEDIKKEAIRLGEKTMFDPQEAAKVMTELIRGGATADTVINGEAEAVLNLAQATGEDLDTATKAVITSTTQWTSQNLTAKDAVDQLTRAANASAATVEQLSGGLKNLGGIPASLGVSHEDTLALLGALSQAGLKGPEGGTALRYFFLNLIPGTQKSIELMKELHLMEMDLGHDQEYLGKSANVQAMNQEQLVQAMWEKWSGTKRLFKEAIAEEDPAVTKFQQFMARNQLITSQFVDQKTGQLKDATQLMQILWDKLGKMDPAQRAKEASALFGERGGSKGAINLLNAYEANLKTFESGATDSKGNKLSDNANIIQAMRDEMRGLGDAQSIAEQRTQTFSGAVERLGSNFQSLKIAIGDPLLKPLAMLLNKFSDFIGKVTAYLQANPKLLEAVGRIGLIASGLAGILGPLTMLSAAFPYVIAGIRGVMLAAAPMGLLFGLLASLVTGVVMAVMDPKLGMMPVLKNLQGAFMVFGSMVQQSLGQLFQGVIVPIAATLVLLFRDIIAPALFNFLFTLSNALPGAISGFAGFVQTVLIPAFVNLVMWIGTWLPGAINLLMQVWNNLLAPLFMSLVGLIEQHALPMLSAIGGFLSQFIPAAINVFMSVWTTILAPAIDWLAGIIEQYVLPILGQLANWLGQVLPPIFQVIGYVLQTYVFPFIGKFIQLISMVLPPIMDVVGVIIQFLIPVFKFAFDTIGPILLTLMDIVIWVFNIIGGALNWLGQQWETGFFGLREPMEGLWNFIVDLWNKIVDAFKWLGDKIGGFLEWLGIKSKEGGEKAGENFGGSLNDKLKDEHKNTVENVNQFGLTFAGLAGPAGISGYTAGFNFTGGILDGLNANIPAIQATIDAITKALNATLDQFEQVKNSAPEGVISDLDKKALRLSKQLASANHQIAIAKKAQFAPGSYGNPDQSGYDGSSGSDGTDSSGDNPYDTQTDNRAGSGGGGGGGGGSTRTAAEAAADEAKKVFDAVKAGIDAFRALSRMQIPSNVEAKTKEFATAVARIVKNVADIARGYLDKDGKTPLLDVAGAFGEAAGKAFDMISKGIEAFSKLKDFEAPAKDALTSFLSTVDWVQKQVAQIATKGYTAEQLVQSEQFADAASKSMDMLDKGLDAFAKVGKFVKPTQERLSDLVQTIKVAVQDVASISDSIGPEAQASAAEYSGYAATIVDAIGKVADLVQKLNDPKLDLKPVTDKVQALANEMLAMMNYVGALWTQNPGWTPENAAKVAALGDSAAKVGAGLGAVADMLAAIQKDGGKTNYPALADRVRELSDAMVAMMNYLGPISAPWDGFTELPAKFAEDGGKVAGGLVSLMDMFKALSDRDTQKIEFRNLADRVTELANALAQMVNAVRTAVGQVPDVAGLSDYTDTASKASDALLKLIDLFKAMGEKGLKEASPEAVNDLVGRMVGLVTDFSTALKAANIALDENGVEIAKAQGDIADSIGKIVGSLASTLDLLDKASQFKQGKTDPHTVIDKLLGFMLDFVTQFAAARDKFAAQVSAETAQLADDVAKTVSSLGGALDTFDKLSTFKGVAQARIDLFMTAMQDTVTALKPLVDSIAPDMLDLAKDFGEKLGPAFDLLSKALDLFKAITGEVDKDGNVSGQFRPVDPAAIGEFTGKLLLLINRLRDDLLTKVAPEMMDLAKEFGEKFGPAMDALAKALDFFLKIQGSDQESELKPIDPDAIGAVVGSIYILMNHWRNLITGNNGEFQSAEFAQKTDTFSTLVTQVLSSLNEMLDLANKIVEANKDGGIDKLPDQIHKLVAAMQAAAGLVAPQVEGEWGAMFTDMSDAIFAQTDETQQKSIAALWWGENGILRRMWKAVDGKGAFRALMKVAWQGVFDDLGAILDAWATAVKPVWGAAMQDLANTAVNAVNQIKATLGELTSSGITVDYTVSWSGPKLATGGIVTRPTLAMVGEGHEPEAVIPLSKLGSYTNAGQSKTVVNNWNIRQVAVKRTSDLAAESQRLRRQSIDNT